MDRRRYIGSTVTTESLPRAYDASGHPRGLLPRLAQLGSDVVWEFETRGSLERPFEQLIVTHRAKPLPLPAYPILSSTCIRKLHAAPTDELPLISEFTSILSVNRPMGVIRGWF